MPQSFPRTRAAWAGWSSDGLAALVLAGTGLWLGGVTSPWVVWGWGGLAAVIGIRLLDTETAWRWPSVWLVPWLVWLVGLAGYHSVDSGAAAREVENWIPIALWLGVGASSRSVKPGLIGLVSVAVVGVGISLWQVAVQPGWLMAGRWQAEQYLGRASGPFGNPNQWAAFVLLLIPWAWAVAANGDRSRLTRVLAGWFLLLCCVSLLLSQSRGAWLAAVGIGCVAALRFRRVKSGAVGLGLVLLVLLAVGPWRERLGSALLQRGETARAVLWTAGMSAIRENLWLGVGPGGFETDFERRRPAGFSDAPGLAHSDPLQVVWETGIVGGGLGVLGVAGLVVSTRARRRPGPPGSFVENERSAFGWGIAAFAAASFVDFHWHIPGTAWPAAWLLGAWAKGCETNIQDSLIYKNRVGALGGALSLGIALHFGEGAHRAALAEQAQEHALQEWRSFRDKASLTPEVEDALQRSVDELKVAVTRWPDARDLWVSLSELQGHLAAVPREGAGHAGEAEKAARTALSLSSAPADGWLVLGVSLQRQGRQSEAGEAFQEALRRAPRSARVWYQFAYYLVSQPGGESMGRVAIENCLHLDPSHRGAQALQQKLSSTQ